MVLTILLFVFQLCASEFRTFFILIPAMPNSELKMLNPIQGGHNEILTFLIDYPIECRYLDSGRATGDGIDWLIIAPHGIHYDRGIINQSAGD